MRRACWTSSSGPRSMSYETDGSSDSSPHSNHASPPEGGAGSPSQSESSPPQCTSSHHPNPGQKARNEAEKHRRDRINRGVSTLSCMVAPAYLPKQQKKIDKITTLRLAANYMRRAFIQCFVESLGGSKKSVLPEQIIEVIQNFSEDSGFWLTINRRGKVLDVTEGIQHLLGYSLVDVANEDLSKFVEEAQRDLLMTEKLLGYPEDGSGMVPKNVTLQMMPKPTGRKDSLRCGSPVHVRGFMGPIQALLGSVDDADLKIGAEARQRLVPDDEVILVARVTPAAMPILQTDIKPRPENEYFLQVRSDGVIVGCDSRISLCAGYMPSEVSMKSAHSFLHVDDQMWAAVRQGLMFLYPQEFNSVTVRLFSNTGEVNYVYVRGNVESLQQSKLPEGHFATRQVLISEAQARKQRREEMAQLQRFLRDVLMGKYPQHQVHAMVAAIMGPMMGEMAGFPEAPVHWTEEFSPSFNLCMFRMLADFSRSMPPLTEAPSNWPPAAPDANVAIAELPVETEVSSATAAPMDRSEPMDANGDNGDTLMSDFEPLRVDTCTESDLQSILSECSESWQKDNEAVAVTMASAVCGPSPCSSEASSATYPSPTSTTAPQRRQQPRNGAAQQQYNVYPVQQSPSSSQRYVSGSPGFTNQSPGGIPVSPGYAGLSPGYAGPGASSSFTGPGVSSSYPGRGVSPVYAGPVASPAYAGPGASPGYAGSSPGCAGISPGCAGISPGCAGISPGYAGVSPGYGGHQYVSPTGAAPLHPTHNGQVLVSPPYGNVVRQSCQFQPAAAPVSAQFQQPHMLPPQAAPALTYATDYAQHSQGGLMNRNCVSQVAAPLLADPDLALDMLLTPPTAANTPSASEDVAMGWTPS